MILDSLKNRRSYYQINKNLPTSEQAVIDVITGATELVPHAFNAKSNIVYIVLGEKQDQLWDLIYDAFGGQVDRAKIDSFKAGYGTVLYFVNKDVVSGLQQQFPLYADNFPLWANQSAGMLQLSIWTALRELGIGASLQHYNPVINEAVAKFLNVPENYTLNAQMPFGGIAAEPEAKPAEDMSARVKIVK